ncbi:MAG TPA: serine hydrolase domain-containing protein [Chthonomonadales bacterium]|nr:serine hydrolase domain-containing protein [Chthonomonadales bacterium]
MNLIRLSRVALLPVFAFALVAGASPSRASEHDARLAELERSIERRRAEMNAAGLAVAVVQGDRVVLLRGFGMRDVGGSLPVTPDTLFAIGSSTKAFTALTVLQAVDEGRMKLTDHPRVHLPSFRLQDPVADARITVEDLLSHRSGLPRTDLAWAGGRLSSEQLVRVAGAARPTAPFGTRWQYQNVMYMAAGMTVARASGRPWREVVWRRVLRPLGMRTSNTSVRQMQARADHARGYRWDAGAGRHEARTMRDLGAIAPAGAINSSAREMAQWVRLLLGRGAVDGRRLVSDTGFNEWLRVRMPVGPNAGYALGWMVSRRGDAQAVEHGGNIDGFSALVAFLPEKGVGLVALTNAEASGLPAAVRDLVYDALVGPVAQPAAPPASASVGAPVPPSQAAGDYRLAAANLTITVRLAEGRLVLRVPGQPDYTLDHAGGGRYRLGAPAPSGFFATFRPSASEPGRLELFLEQPHGNVVLQRVEQMPFESPISIDELMAKAIAAAGGEEALRRHRTAVARYAVSMEHEGLTGRAVRYAESPNRAAITLTAEVEGRTALVIRTYHDGRQGGEEMSFARPRRWAADAVAAAAAQSALHAPLGWRERYPTARIVGRETLDGEDVFVVQLMPQSVPGARELYSARTFLLVGREDGRGLSERFSEYQSVDGVMVPFRRVRSAPTRTVMRLTSLRFGAPVPRGAFAPSPSGVPGAVR